MPVLITEAEREALLEKHEGPAPLLDLLATAGFRAADAAFRLGVFNCLAEGSQTAVSLAQQLNTDPRGMQILLEALTPYGYVTRDENGRYHNTPIAQNWLCPPADPNGYDYTRVHRFWSTILFQLWDDLESSIREGKPAINFYEWLEEHPQTLHDFQAMLSGLAQMIAPELVTAVSLSADKPLHLLDLGGSHAHHTIAFCHAQPNLQATIMDYEGALGVGRENIQKEGLTERVNLTSGNFMTDELGTGYDLVLLCNIVHGLQPEENVALLRRIWQALNAGGQLVIVEQLVGQAASTEDSLTHTFNHTFKLNLFHLLGAQTYALEEVNQWLLEAGFDELSHTLISANSDSIVIGKKL